MAHSVFEKRRPPLLLMEADKTAPLLPVTGESHSSTTVDNYGQLEATTSPKGDLTKYHYDALGRMDERREYDNVHHTIAVATWNYYETEGKKGLLKQVCYNGNQSIRYDYDSEHLNRLSAKTETLFGNTYTTSYTYDDAAGFPLRLSSMTYPTGFVTYNIYHPISGKPYRINNSDGLPLWEALEANASGQVTKCRLGERIVSAYEFRPETMRLEGIYSYAGENILQNLGYSYDDFGNLAARLDKMRNLMEEFTYDHLDRLETITLNQEILSRISYDPLGRMISKQADGHDVFASAQYDYVGPDGQLRPHAIKSAEMNDNPFASNGVALAVQVGSHATVGGLATWACGGNFWVGFATSAAASLVSSGTSVLCKSLKVPAAWTKVAIVSTGCMTAGVTSWAMGGDFMEGVCNGLICAGLNHAMHLACETISGPDDPPKKGKQASQTQKIEQIKQSVAVGTGEAAFIETAAYTTLTIDKTVTYGTKTISKIGKVGSVVGIAGAAAGIVMDYQSYDSGAISQNEFYARTMISVIEVGLSWLCPPAGLVLSTVDMCGGMDWLYKKF